MGDAPRPALVPDPRIRVAENEVDFQLVEGLRFRVTPDEVRREWDAGRVGPDVVAAQESGPVWAWQRHLRRRLVLHASALVMDGKAICIAARSGTGKSTLAAALRETGAGFLTDDLTSIAGAPINLEVEAGPPHVRMWPDTQVWARLPPSLFRLLMEGHDKGVMDLHPVAPVAPLGGVVSLERGDSLALTRLQPADGLIRLVQQTYVYQNYRSMVHDWPPEPWHFVLCAQVARTVPLWSLQVPNGMVHVQEAASMLRRAVADAVIT